MSSINDIPEEYRIHFRKTFIEKCKITNDKLYVYTYKDYSLLFRFENKEIVPCEYVCSDVRNFGESRKEAYYITRNNEQEGLICIKIFNRDSTDSFEEWFTHSECEKIFKRIN